MGRKRKMGRAQRTMLATIWTKRTTRKLREQKRLKEPQPRKLKVPKPKNLELRLEQKEPKPKKPKHLEEEKPKPKNLALGPKLMQLDQQRDRPQPLRLQPGDPGSSCHQQVLHIFTEGKFKFQGKRCAWVGSRCFQLLQHFIFQMIVRQPLLLRF
jgi:hypothetical protein